MNKIVCIGSGDCGHVYCKIAIADGRLSITGVEGPKKNGDARGGCGQIVPVSVSKFAAGWDAELLARFNDLWTRWHLNYMRPGCEHQRAAGWAERPIDPSKPLDTYGTHFVGFLSGLPESQLTPAWV